MAFGGHCLFQDLEWYGLKLDIGLYFSMYNSALVLANSAIEMASSSISFSKFSSFCCGWFISSIN